MREVKKHWWGKDKTPLCGANSIKFANKKRSVSCKSCAKILAGYQGEAK